MRMPSNIYIYKMTVDNGGAPCVWRNQLSLAICKTHIRRKALCGDAIIGFGGKRLDGRLIYAAVVTDKPPTGKYYSDRAYAGRPDRIYRKVNGKPKRLRAAKYHAESDESGRDVGKKFERADVLLSRDFRYLGCDDSPLSMRNFPLLKELLANLTQGHRVHHDPKLRQELLRFLRKLWADVPPWKRTKPTDIHQEGRCNRDEGSVNCN